MQQRCMTRLCMLSHRYMIHQYPITSHSLASVTQEFLSTVLEPALTYAILYLAPHGHIPILDLRAEAWLDTEYTHPGEPPRRAFYQRRRLDLNIAEESSYDRNVFGFCPPSPLSNVKDISKILCSSNPAWNDDVALRNNHSK
jgi:hypothetical protein